VPALAFWVAARARAARGDRRPAACDGAGRPVAKADPGAAGDRRRCGRLTWQSARHCRPCSRPRDGISTWGRSATSRTSSRRPRSPIRFTARFFLAAVPPGQARASSTRKASEASGRALRGFPPASQRRRAMAEPARLWPSLTRAIRRSRVRVAAHETAAQVPWHPRPRGGGRREHPPAAPTAGLPPRRDTPGFPPPTLTTRMADFAVDNPLPLHRPAPRRGTGLRARRWVTPEQAYTYAELAALVDRPRMTAATCVEPEQRVGLLMADGHRFARRLFGALKLGAVAVRSIPPGRRELGVILDAVAPGSWSPTSEAGPRARSRARGAAVVDFRDARGGRSSGPCRARGGGHRRHGVLALHPGTTGTPKAVVHCHRTLLTWSPLRP